MSSLLKSFLIPLCAGLVLAAGPASAQQRGNISVDFKDASFTTIVRFLESNYGYDFTYQTEDVAGLGNINLTQSNATIQNIMSQVLRNTNLTFSVQGQSVVISKFARPAVYTGRVQDQHGRPLGGATVSVKGTQTGNITDSQGNFRLMAAPTDNMVFIFSYMGYQTQEVKISNTDPITVTLLESAASIDQVIVTGYQNIPKNQMVGSGKSIDMDDINQIGANSVDQMLAGQVAGMISTVQSGESHATARIRIRGISTINGAKSPLWVLDGMILEDPVDVDHSDLNSPDAAYLIGNAIAGINPGDIETITVLKDAAATSVYGIRAANGVIIVTTKKGRAGKTGVGYSGSVTYKARESYRNVDLMNATERIDLSREIIGANLAYKYAPREIGYEGLYLKFLSKQITADEFDSEVQKMAKRNTDWYDLLFRNTFSQNHTVSLNGGNENTTYRASLGYTHNPDPGRESKSERYTASIRLDSRLSEKLLVSFRLNSYMTNNTGYHNSVNPSHWAENTARTIPAYNDDGSYYFYEQPVISSALLGGDGNYRRLNYLYELEQTGSESRTTNTNASLDVQWNVTSFLRYSFQGSINNSRTTMKQWAMEHSNYVLGLRGYPVGYHPIGSEEAMESRLPYGGVLSNTESENTTYSIKNQIDLNFTVADNHHIAAWAASEIRSQKRYGLASTLYGWYPAGQQVNPYVTEGNYEKYRDYTRPVLTDYTFNTVSWIGNANYNYKDIWIVYGTVRMDGSSAFGENPEYRFLPIWSAGVRWNVAKERFLENAAWLRDLAFRISYGIQGNVDKNTSPDLVIRRASRDNNRSWYESTIAFFPNADLRWEKTGQFSTGIDFDLFAGRLAGALDYYHKKHTDLILERDISHVNGMNMVNQGATALQTIALATPTYKINGGEMRNIGFEIDLTGWIVRTDDYYIMKLTQGQDIGDYYVFLSQNTAAQQEAILSDMYQKMVDTNPMGPYDELNPDESMTKIRNKIQLAKAYFNEYYGTNF